MQNLPRIVAVPLRLAAYSLILATFVVAGCAPGHDGVPAPAASLGAAADSAADVSARPDDAPRTDPGIPAAFAGADTVRIDTIALGVRHLYAWDPRGPWGIHLLEIDAARCGPVYEARKAGPPQSARARTGALAADALAGINADFFRLPGGTTVSAHVEGGRIVAGPGARPVVALGDGRWWIGRAALQGLVARRGGDVIAPIVQVNRTHPGDTAGVVLFTEWYGEATPVEDAGGGEGAGPAAAGTSPAGTAASAPAGGAVRVTAVTVRQLDPAADAARTSGRTVAEGAGAVGVVAAVDSMGGSQPLSPGTVVLHGRGSTAAALRRLAVGDTVVWSTSVISADGARRAAREAVGGYPVLLRDGEFAPEMEEGVNPSFGERRHPRTAVGFADDGRRMFWLVVDGRQDPYSDGMSLREVATLLRDLGAEEALNLDGGGSSALVVRGRVANRPSDPTGERPVGNALVLAGCRAEGAG